MATLRPTQELYRAHRQELTDPWVGPGATRHTEMITRYADELIDNWITLGRTEFISEFARPLPQLVLAAILGFPREDVSQLAEWGKNITAATKEKKIGSIQPLNCQPLHR